MDTHEQRQRLLARRSEARQRLRAARRDLQNLRDGAGELSTLDNHPADAASDVFDRGLAAGLHADAVSQLAAIDTALRRLDEGSYGRCELCRRPIAPARLQVLPEAVRCQTCAGDREDWRRPPEEDQLATTLAHMAYDERAETGRRLADMLEDFGSASGPGGTGRNED